MLHEASSASRCVEQVDMCMIDLNSVQSKGARELILEVSNSASSVCQPFLSSTSLIDEGMKYVLKSTSIKALVSESHWYVPEKTPIIAAEVD